MSAMYGLFPWLTIPYLQPLKSLWRCTQHSRAAPILSEVQLTWRPAACSHGFDTVPSCVHLHWIEGSMMETDSLWILEIYWLKETSQIMDLADVQNHPMLERHMAWSTQVHILPTTLATDEEKVICMHCVAYAYASCQIRTKDSRQCRSMYWNATRVWLRHSSGCMIAYVESATWQNDEALVPVVLL